MPTDSSPIIFVASGEPIAANATRSAEVSSQVRAVRIAGATRGGTLQRLSAQPGQDIVELTIGSAHGDSPDLRLRLHPEHARDLMRAQNQANVPTRAAGATAEEDGTVPVPASAQWQGLAAGASRGLLSELAFKTLALVGLDPQDALARMTAVALGKKLDGQVNEGVYRLQQHHLGSLKLADRVTALPDSTEPILVLIHGTFVDTASSFGRWWGGHSSLVAHLFAHYEERVYALDHGTVMRSPIANALTLAETLPDGARLHLLTHSRGGLVAEALLRASIGVSDADLDLFNDAAHARHRADLARLGEVLREKHIRVERIVRAACPAYGTLLASDRLDAYLSVLAWLLERAGLPLAPELVRFADAVARQRADPALFPGIEAMRSASRVLRWLNQDSAPADSALRVVAGDITGESLVSWIKVLLADSFYRTDNDLVVQTRSMYGGMVRARDASFMLDRSGKTDHVSYFGNDVTASGMARALMQDQPDGFASIGPLSRQGKDAGGVRAAQQPQPQPQPAAEDDGKRPAVLLLPDFMGSNLAQHGQRAWVDLSRLHGLFDCLACNGADGVTEDGVTQDGVTEDGVTEDGPVDSHYGDLIAHLEASHSVVRCGYDWRAPLTSSAALLAERLEQALERRAASGQPVRVLAHGMGCLVLRVMQLEHPQTWTKMLHCDGARVLMLAPPNRGCWAPMALFSGDDPFAQLLAGVGGAAHAMAARRAMARFPALLQCQAGLTDWAPALGDAACWQEMAAHDDAAARQAHPWHSAEVAAWRWALPSQADLNAAVQLWRRLDAQLPALLGAAASMAIVLGHAPATPCGVQRDDKGIHYRGSAEGDGRVTWASSRLPGVATWKTGYPHGDLPRLKANFNAYAELLASGRTSRLGPQLNLQPQLNLEPEQDLERTLEHNSADAGGAPVMVLPRLRDSAPLADGATITADALRDAALGSTVSAPREDSAGGAALPRDSKIEIEIIHGDLKFIREPLLLGHLRALQLTGSEAVVDQLMGHALQDALDVGLYPVQLGEHQIFANRYAEPDNPFAFPRPVAAIVVGLGDEGALTPNGLADAVRQAVLAYQRQAQSPIPAQGAAAGQGAGAGCTTLGGITLASTTLGSGGGLSVGQSVLALVRGVGDANTRLAAAPARLAWPPVTRLHIVELFHSRALDAWHTLHLAIQSGTLAAVLLPQVRQAHGARTLPTDGHYRAAGYDLVRISAAAGAPGQRHDELEFSLFTKRARSEVRGKSTQRALVAAMVATAEMDTRFDADLARGLFQLLVPQEIKAYLGAAGTLVFEVDSKTAGYPWEMLNDTPQPAARMPFALRPGGTLLRKMRVDCFRRQPADANTDDVLVIGAPKLDGVPALPDLPGARGEANAVAALFGTTALLDQGFLAIVTAALARPWKIIHLAGHGQYDAQGGRSGMLMSDGLRFGPSEFESMDAVPELVFVNCCHLGKTKDGPQRNHALFAANVAEQLIRNGVRCVVAAGWAVDDGAAQAFALGFYSRLQGGATFADAVLEGRQRAYACEPDSNTWAAYQCYGDPAWTLHRNALRDGPAIKRSKTAVLAAPGELLVALEAVGRDAEGASSAARGPLRDTLLQLETVAPDAWQASGKVAEAFGMAWRDVGSSDDKAKALAWLDRAVKAADGTASLGAREQQLNLRARQGDTAQAIRKTIDDIKALIALAPTAERWSMLGSAWKRVVIKVEINAEPVEGLEQMQHAYAQAEALKPDNLHYPLMQRCLAQMRLHWLSNTATPTPADVQALRQSLTQQEAFAPDFWCVVGQHEARMLEGVIEGTLAARMDAIEQGMRDVQGRVSNPHYWSSLHDTARFLLPAYIANATEEEAAAANAYLTLLGSFI